MAALSTFEARFISEGVEKTSHLTDVTVEDFILIGLTAVQIRRLQRLYNLKHNDQTADKKKERKSNDVTTALMAPKENKKQWENKKLGFIPNPQTERARFLNEKVLPAFYKSQYRFSMNAREFSKLFHSEGRREYDLHKAISSLEEKIAVQEKPMNMPLSPSDNAQLNYKSTQLENLKMKAEQISKELKNDDDSCFTNLGKVKSTRVCTSLQ